MNINKTSKQLEKIYSPFKIDIQKAALEDKCFVHLVLTSTINNYDLKVNYKEVLINLVSDMNKNIFNISPVSSMVKSLNEEISELKELIKTKESEINRLRDYEVYYNLHYKIKRGE